MLKVMAFGTFDVLHPGHEYFLKKAKKLGDTLVVIISRDATVLKIKNHRPKHSEKIRIKNLTELNIADKVILGSRGKDKYQVIRSEKPDIIALGYDQVSFTENLKHEFGSKIKIIRIAPFRSNIYKSSKIFNYSEM